MANLTTQARQMALSQWTDSPQSGPMLPLELTLVTAMGDADTAGDEIGGADYERQSLDLSLDGSDLVNDTEVAFTEADGTAVGFEVYDDEAQRWWYGELVDSDGQPIEVELRPGYRIAFAVGEIQLTIT